MDITPNPTTKSEKDVCNLAARASAMTVTSPASLSPQTDSCTASATVVTTAADDTNAAATTPTNATSVCVATAMTAMMTERKYTAAESELLMKCVHLIQGRIGRTAASAPTTTSTSSSATVAGGSSAITASGSIPSTLAVGDAAASSPGYDEGCADMNVSYMSGNSIELCSPDRLDMPNGWEAPAPATQTTALQPLRLYVPELEEIRVSPVVARKGYLNVLEHGGSGWKKRWVVSLL